MLKKFFLLRIWRRIYLERLGEPFIYNLISLFYLFFGNFEKKIDYDLVPRQPYAFGLKEAFRRVSLQKLNVKKILILEFGVASGTGLFNLQSIADRLSKIYNLDYEVIGFDTGKGMPKALDYRDHPEKYKVGDFPPLKLSEKNLPKKTKIFYGDIKNTVHLIKNELIENSVVGFISIDVDYYSSTISCLESLKFESFSYLPSTIIYFDDVNNPDHNEFCGQLLAIREFNKANQFRKISKMTQLRNWRYFKNALWLDQMYFLHVLDHKNRDPKNTEGSNPRIIGNPYL